jgi:hypothetical protein
VVAPGQAAVGERGSDAGEGVEGGNAAASGAEFLREGALRDEFDLQLAGEVLAGELLVLADDTSSRPWPARTTPG